MDVILLDVKILVKTVVKTVVVPLVILLPAQLIVPVTVKTSALLDVRTLVEPIVNLTV